MAWHSASSWLETELKMIEGLCFFLLPTTANKNIFFQILIAHLEFGNRAPELVHKKSENSCF